MFFRPRSRANGLKVEKWHLLLGNIALLKYISINLAVARVGSIIGSILSPILYEINGNITIPLFAGLCFLFISALSTLSLFYLDTESDKRDLAE
jgi:hypothetical protein